MVITMPNSETTFVFRKSKYFWKFVNKQFDLSNMNDIFDKVNEGDYTFVLAEQVPNDVYTCIDSETGCLIEDADGLDIIDLTDVYSNLTGVEDLPYFKLYCDWIRDGESGFTLNMDSGSTDVQIQLGDSQTIYLQGMFLCKREASKTHDENFVLAYAVIGQPINIRNFINVPFQSMIMGIGYCANQQQ